MTIGKMHPTLTTDSAIKKEGHNKIHIEWILEMLVNLNLSPTSLTCHHQISSQKRNVGRENDTKNASILMTKRTIFIIALCPLHLDFVTNIKTTPTFSHQLLTSMLEMDNGHKKCWWKFQTFSDFFTQTSKICLHF